MSMYSNRIIYQCKMQKWKNAKWVFANRRTKFFFRFHVQFKQILQRVMKRSNMYASVPSFSSPSPFLSLSLSLSFSLSISPLAFGNL